MPTTESSGFSLELGFTPELIGRHATRARWIGVAFIILGVLAMLLPGVFTIGFEIFLGILLLVGGILQMVSAFGFVGQRGWGCPMAGGVLATVLGALFLIDPFEGAAALTVFLAALFFISGIFRIIHGLQWRGVPGIGWGVLSGLFGIIIAVLVFTAWPASSLWFIGILLGVDFLVVGIFLNVFASACRRDVEADRRSRGDSSPDRA